MKITTNNVPRDVLNAWDLTDKELKEFDYLDKFGNTGKASHTFFRYKGEVYDLGDFMIWESLPNPFTQDDNKWEAYMSDTFFSGIVIRYVDDYEAVIVGRYCE